MPTVKVPLFDTVFTNTQGVVLNDKLSSLINGYVDALDGYHKFPGTSSLYDFGLGAGVSVDGAYWWQERQLIILVIAGRIFKMTYVGAVVAVTEITGTGVTLVTGTSVSFATDGTYLFLTNGSRIVYTDGVTATYMADADIPLTLSHVSYLDTYILGSAVGGRFYWSNVGDSLSWSALNFATAGASPDTVVAHHVFNREIYLFGPQTIELWENDGTTPFARVPGGAIQLGCIAPYSIIKRDEGFYFLDSKRRICSLNGRSPQFIDCPYQKEIQGLSYVSDCIGLSFEEAGQAFLKFIFPAANRTFYLNLTTKKWGETGKWNSTDSNYQRWIGNCYCYCDTWDLHIVGGSGTSKVYQLSQSFYSEDGDILRDARRSGDIDYGTSKEKRSNEFRVRLKRGDGSSTTPVIMFRYRTNGRYWSTLREISLGDSGEYDIFKKIPCRGIFRSRQYEITSTDAIEIVQADAEEDIDILR